MSLCAKGQAGYEGGRPFACQWRPVEPPWALMEMQQFICHVLLAKALASVRPVQTFHEMCWEEGEMGYQQLYFIILYYIKIILF